MNNAAAGRRNTQPCRWGEECQTVTVVLEAEGNAVSTRVRPAFPRLLKNWDVVLCKEQRASPLTVLAGLPIKVSPHSFTWKVLVVVRVALCSGHPGLGVVTASHDNRGDNQ